MERKYLRQWSYNFWFLLLLVNLFACNTNNVKKETFKEFSPEVEEALDSINSYSEEATEIYRESIRLLNNNLNPDSVNNLFQDDIKGLRNKINNQLNKVNNLYKQQKISDNEFIKFREKLDFNKIKQLSKQLDSLGVKY